MWKKLAYFAGGLMIGGAAGYFAGKYIAEEKSRTQVAKQMAELEDFYKKRDDARQKAHELNELKEKMTEEVLTTSATEDATKVIDYSKIAEQRIEGKAYVDDGDEWGDAKRPKGAPKQNRHTRVNEISDEPYYESQDGAAVYPSEPGSEPVIISEQAYASDVINEKVTLFWFTGDNVVTDEEYQPLEDLSVIGEGWEQHFGEEDDPDVVHVRNPKLNVDYEIIRDHRSYATTIPE